MRLSDRCMDTIDRHSRFADMLLVVLTIFTCTYFIYRDFEIRMLYGYGLMGLVLGVHLLGRIRRRSFPRLGLVKWAYLVMCGLIFLSFLRPDSNHDTDTTSYMIAMILCGGYLFFAEPGEKEAGLAMKLLLIAALAMAAYILFFIVFEDLFWVTVYPLVSPTQQAYLTKYVPKGYSVTVGGCTYTDYILFLGAAVCAGNLAVSREKNWKTALSGATILLLVCTIMLTGRRGEFLGAVLALVLFALFLCSKKQRWMLIGGGSVLVLVAFGAVVLMLPVLKEIDAIRRYVMTVENLLSGKDITSGRLELYTLAWRLFCTSPVFGIGWQNFGGYVTPEFQELHGPGVKDVHNIYLQFLCETGIVGAVLIILPLGYIFVRTWRHLRYLMNHREESKTWAFAVRAEAASFVIQGFFLVIGIFDPCFTKLVFWCFYTLAVLLMLASQASIPAGRDKSENKFPKRKAK